MLITNGHRVLVTSRKKDCAIDLLEDLNIPHTPLSEKKGKSIMGTFSELLLRDYRLIRTARNFRADVIAAVGGTSAAHASRALGIPGLVFYDTEDARLQNLLTYPFAAKVYVPDCYSGSVPAAKTIRYSGYHELAYLHPNHFRASRSEAVRNGLDPDKDNFFIRVVEWAASHDVGYKGWSEELLQSAVSLLASRGKVIISSEAVLPVTLEKYRYQGNVSGIHHLMAYCRLSLGESATMASECVVLGTPSIYCSDAPRSYISEQSEKHRLAVIVSPTNQTQIFDAVQRFMELPSTEIQRRHQALLDTTIDVSDFVYREIVSSAAINSSLRAGI